MTSSRKATTHGKTEPSALHFLILDLADTETLPSGGGGDSRLLCPNEKF